MKKIEELFVVYNFIQKEGEANSQYQIIYFYDSRGEITLSPKRKTSEPFKQIEKNNCFATKEEFTEFIQNYLNEYGYQYGHILSADDFNIGIESCHNLFTFREIFKRYGTQIEKDVNSKKSILSKLF